jgi:hypothetical protein
MHAEIRPLDPAGQAEVTADVHALPHGRITEHDGAAHVFTAGLTELQQWHAARPGRITRQPAGHGVVLWTLHTATSHGTPVHVHALALDTDQIDDDCTPAVA